MIYHLNARSIGEMIKAKMKEQAEQRRVVTLPPRKFDPPKEPPVNKERMEREARAGERRRVQSRLR